MSEEITNLNEEQKELTLPQKEAVLARWNDKELPVASLKDLCEAAFGIGVDGRDKRSRLVKIFMSEAKIKAKPSYVYEPKKAKPQVFELSEENKTFIRNNQSMTSLEIARELFSKPELTSLDVETKAVQGFLKGLEGFVNVNKETLTDYKPPRNFAETVARINRFVAHKLDLEKLSVQQKKDVEVTQAFLQDNRFVFLANAYQRQDLRDLFESSFLKYIHNKASDCNAEETDQYLNLASSIVTQMESMAELNMLKEQQTLYLQNGSPVPKGTADRIGDLESNINALQSYQSGLIKSLQGERSKRVEHRIAENSSVVALISAWKQEEHRKRMINYAQLKEKAIREELDKLTTMDGIKAQLFGIHSSEIVPEQK